MIKTRGHEATVTSRRETYCLKLAVNPSKGWGASRQAVSVPWKLCGEDVKVVSWQSHVRPSSLRHERLGDQPSRNCLTRGIERYPCEYSGHNASEPTWSVVMVNCWLDSRDGKAEPIYGGRRLTREA